MKMEVACLLHTANPRVTGGTRVSARRRNAQDVRRHAHPKQDAPREVTKNLKMRAVRVRKNQWTLDR